jgi:hypothetical protein
MLRIFRLRILVIEECGHRQPSLSLQEPLLGAKVTGTI